MFSLRIDICTDMPFQERQLREFLHSSPYVVSCLQVFTNYDYSINLRVNFIDDFENFRQDITRAVPGIAHMQAGVIGHSLM